MRIGSPSTSPAAVEPPKRKETPKKNGQAKSTGDASVNVQIRSADTATVLDEVKRKSDQAMGQSYDRLKLIRASNEREVKQKQGDRADDYQKKIGQDPAGGRKPLHEPLKEEKRAK